MGQLTLAGKTALVASASVVVIAGLAASRHLPSHGPAGQPSGAARGPAAGDSTITYHMHREGQFAFDEEDWWVQGTVNLHPAVAGTLIVQGGGTFKGHTTSSRYQTRNRCEGVSEIRGGGGAGALLWVGASAVSGSCLYTVQGKTTDRGVGAADSGFRCEFSGVDFAKGGLYEAHANGEESRWAACTLELGPLRK